VRLSRAAAGTRVLFGEPHFVSQAGLVPVMALLERAGCGAWSLIASALAGTAGRTST
jgi:hypothetical protein